MKAEIFVADDIDNPDPQAGHVITMIEYGNGGWTVYVESPDSYYARHLFAHPWRLYKYALLSLHARFRHRMSTKYKTVAEIRETLREIKAR